MEPPHVASLNIGSTRGRGQRKSYTCTKHCYVTNFCSRHNLLEITGGIGDFGDMRWELVGTTILSWVVVFFCLFKGIKSSGKVKYFFNNDNSTVSRTRGGPNR